MEDMEKILNRIIALNTNKNASGILEKACWNLQDQFCSFCLM